MADDLRHESHGNSVDLKNTQGTSNSTNTDMAFNAPKASVPSVDEAIVAHVVMRFSEFVGRIGSKIEGLGDSFVIFTRWFMGLFDLAAVFFFVPKFLNTTFPSRIGRRIAEVDWVASSIYGALSLFAIVGSLAVLSTRTTKELRRKVQDYQDSVAGGVEFGENRYLLEFTVVNYKNIGRAIVDIIACSVAIVLVIALLFSFLSLLAFSAGGSEYAIELLRDELLYGSPVLLLLLIAVAVSLLQKPIGYNLNFSRDGISGKYYYVGGKTASFVDTYEKPAPDDHRYQDLIKRFDGYVQWSNFMCFSYHKNCILLWKNSQPDCNFRNKLYLKLGWFIDLEGDHSRCPLRIVGTEAEITELRNFLSNFMPCAADVCSGKKAVL